MIQQTNHATYWKIKPDTRAHKTENTFARRIFSSIKPRHKTVLDVGCGNGRDAVFFAKKGLIVTAVDFSERSITTTDQWIKNLRLKNIKTIRKDIRKLSFRKNSFDIIYAHLSLHYFNDETTTKIFNALHDMLNPGGLICIKCKSTDDALYGQGKNVGTDMYFKDHLRHFFSKKYMEEKLAQFRILTIRKTSSTYELHKSAFIEAIATK